MDLKTKVENYLQIQPLARERKNKDRALVNILLTMYPQFKDIPKETLTEFVHTFSSLDRYWRLVLEERSELRGSDYQDKVKLEQERKLSLGYQPGHHYYTKQVQMKL